MLSLARNLVAEQRFAFDLMVDYAKKVIKCRKNDQPLPKALRPLITGGAGTGKSFCIKSISKWTEAILRKSGDHPNLPRVLVVAPTGIAASLIDGITLDSAFNFKFGSRDNSISDRKIDHFRNALKDLKVVVGDEFSLMGSDKLIRTHYRFKEIFQTHITDLFANKAMVLVGDVP